MFGRESNMVASTSRWMKVNGLAVKSEFVTPWGICDLVGISFNQNHVAHRLRLRQTKSVSSITRSFLLLLIPDVDKHKSVSLDKLISKCVQSIPEDIIYKEVDRLIADHFVVRTLRGKLQKMNGWMPLHNRLVAVELKLSRIDEAMRQARNNLGFADESYVALPLDVAHRVISNLSRWVNYFNDGVGLLGITQRKCYALVPGRRGTSWIDETVQFYCVEKFWRTRLKDN